jgi:FlaG/FlaF family flagellin (archaellin)
MSKLTRFATPLMAVAIMSSVPFMALAQTSQSLVNDGTTVSNSNTPTAENVQMQQGYKDGVEAAKLDKLANRPVSFKSSHLYVNPPVKKDARDAYRSSFQAGYEAAAAAAHTPAS